jgi:hypothetical protein
MLPPRNIYMKIFIPQLWWIKPSIPATLEAEIRRLSLKFYPRQKVRKTLFQQINQCDPSYTGGPGWRTAVQTRTKQKM